MADSLCPVAVAPHHRPATQHPVSMRQGVVARHERHQEATFELTDLEYALEGCTAIVDDSMLFGDDGIGLFALGEGERLPCRAGEGLRAEHANRIEVVIGTQSPSKVLKRLVAIGEEGKGLIAELYAVLPAVIVVAEDAKVMQRRGKVAKEVLQARLAKRGIAKRDAPDPQAKPCSVSLSPSPFRVARGRAFEGERRSDRAGEAGRYRPRPDPGRVIEVLVVDVGWRPDRRTI